jgi:heme exporter protein CcmD
MLDLDFGKYGPFIWGAYGITGLVFALMILSSLRHSAHWRRRAEELKAQEDVRP